MSETIDQNVLATEIMAEHKRSPHKDLSGAELHLHVTLHAVAETQLRSGEPAETRQTLERLMRDGLDRHLAVHAICSVVASEFMQVAAGERAFDAGRYTAALRALEAADWEE